MARKTKSASTPSKKNAALGFEAQLWAAADKMRGHMDASEYKHVRLGLIFLKYISDAFEVANTEQTHDYLLIRYPPIVPKCYGKFGLFTWSSETSKARSPTTKSGSLIFKTPTPTNFWPSINSQSKKANSIAARR